MPGAMPYRDDDADVDADVQQPALRHPRPHQLEPADDVELERRRTGHPPPRPAPRPPAFEGLTASGAAVVGLVGTTVGAVLDAVLSPGLGWIFFVAFALSSAFVGLRLRGRDAWATVGIPPLVYISAAGIAAQAAPVTEGSWLDRTSGDMAGAVLDHPYALLIGTGFAVVAFGYRAVVR